jgi:quinol monooxygenase YgiN
MASQTALTRIVTFRARPGEGAELAERLLQAASMLAEAPGCELWLVHQDRDDPDTVRASEMWASTATCDAALTRDGVAENAEQLMSLLDRPPESVDGDPLGGARVLRGTMGQPCSTSWQPPISRRTQSYSVGTTWTRSARRATYAVSLALCKAG